MAVKLVLLGTTYEIPSPGESPNWGEALTAYLTAVNEFLTLIIDPNDILPTEENILNNQPSDVLVKGLVFNSSLVRAANVTYSIIRETDSSTVVETGVLLLNYDPDAPATEKWQFTQTVNDNAGVILSVTDAGQFYYQSNDLTGANYTGTIKFTSKILRV